MVNLTRRSLIRGSLGLVGSAALTRPHIANAAATTATVWWVQGFIPEEDASFRALVADYEKASGNKIDYTIIPFAPARQKATVAITSGIVPDVIQVPGAGLFPAWSWQDKLVDVTDVVETQKAQFSSTALLAAYAYNGETKKRSYHAVPIGAGVVPFHIWHSLVEKAGLRISDIPKTWDAFIDFFRPVQDKLRAQGMQHLYAYGFTLSANGNDPLFLFNAFLIAYGGADFVTSDGRLHTDDPKVRQAAVKALVKLTTAFKDGYVPPSVVNWNDADDNNAFHSKLVVMDFDGTISTELALYHKKEEYDDILTLGLPYSNDGDELPSQLGVNSGVIPKGAKNLTVAKEFLKHLIEPKVLNAYLKAGLGRWLPTMPGLAQSDPFWLDDPHVAAYTQQGILSPTIPVYASFNPAMGEVDAEHPFSKAAFDVTNQGMAPEQAIDKAFKRVEAIFAKYPIQQA